MRPSDQSVLSSSIESVHNRGVVQTSGIMPVDDVGMSWAEQVKQGEDESLPPPHEEFDPPKNIKTVTEYKINDNGKKVRVVKTLKLETKEVLKSVGRRKTWKKFGAAETDPPGPNPANTIISEEIYMQFVRSEDLQMQNVGEDPLAKLRGTKMVACRICKGCHWTTRCPYKDTLAPILDILGVDTAAGEGGPTEECAPTDTPKPSGGGGGGSKYVPPSMRVGGNKRGESMSMKGSRGDENASIHVTNLSEEARESDLHELFGPFGNISRIYLARYKKTGQSKGFAFIDFHRREDAARAIAGLSRYGYGHLILNVDWAKPSGNQ